MHFTSADGSVNIQVEGITRIGIASIYDADILLWLCTQIRAHYDKTGEIMRTVHFKPRLMIHQLGRSIGGKQFENLRRAMARLQATTVTTTIRLEHQREDGGFSWLDNWHTRTKDGAPEGYWTATVSDWVVNGIIQDRNILTLHAGYYSMTSGLEKRLYQIARKHAGQQASGWMFTWPTLYEKVGTTDAMVDFKYQVRQIAREKRLLLDYSIKESEPFFGGEVKVWLRHCRFGTV